MQEQTDALVVLRSGRRFIDGVLTVKNYDQAFPKVFGEAEDEWNHCTEEYFDVVLRKLREAGYDAELREHIVIDSNY